MQFGVTEQPIDRLDVMLLECTARATASKLRQRQLTANEQSTDDLDQG